MKKNIAGIGLLFCLLAPLTLTFVWFQYQKHAIKQTVKLQMKLDLDQSEMVLLKFTHAESQTKLHWEHDKEFEYQHQMYDVLKTETKGDTIYYWCWWDQEETALNIQLQTLLKYALNHNPQNENTQELLDNFFKSLYPPKVSTWLVADQFTKHEGFSYYFDYLAVFLSPPIPPPKVDSYL